MKHLLLSILAMGSLLTASFAQAEDFGVEVGFRQQSGTVDQTGIGTKSENGFQLGLSGFFPLQDKLGLRSGLFYVSRPLSIETDNGLPAGDAKITMNYFEVPVALAYKMEDYATLFGGIALSVNLDQKVDGSGVLSGQKVKDVKSPIIPLLVGASFKFAPQLGASVFFESFSGEAAQGLKNYKAVGANLVIFFE